MKLRFLLVAALAGIARLAAQVTPSGIAVSPSSAAPGAAVTITVTASNAGAAITSGTVNLSCVFTNLVTGATFTLAQAGVSTVSGLTAASAGPPPTPGSGTFEYTANLPTETLQAGNYSATVTMTSGTITATPSPGTFSISTGVLAITGSPDLEITSLTYAAGTSYVGGNVISMTMTFTNEIATNGINNVPYVPGVSPGSSGTSAFFRIQVVLSSNPTYGDSDDFQLTFFDIELNSLGQLSVDGGAATALTGNSNSGVLNADGANRTYTWQQLLPGNFAGSYYVLAKIDSLGQVTQNEPAPQTVNGNPIWGGNTLDPSGTLINLLPTTFPTMTLVSHATGVLTSDNGYSDNPSISSDGRYVAFASDATNLVSGDTNGVRDVFLYDNDTTLVRRLSLSQQGAQGNGASNNPAVSADGSTVAFASDANNLVFGDTNGFTDIFAVNTTTGLIARVSVDSSGDQANGSSFTPSASQTGRWIVFESSATNLIAAGTTVGVSHIYLHDRDVSNSGTFDTPGNISTSIIDVTTAGASGNGNSIQPVISSDGSTVAFASSATNLMSSATTNGVQNVFVCKITSDATVSTKLVSVVNGTGAEGNAASQTPSLSSNGQYVAFASLASNLVAGLPSGYSSIFVNNTTAATPTVTCMSVSSTGTIGTDPSASGFQIGSLNPTISATGRYVTYSSLDNNLTGGDKVGESSTTDANGSINVYVHDRDVSNSGTFDTAGNLLTQMASVNTFGYQTYNQLGVPSTAASNIYPVISSDGRFVAMPSDADNVGGLAFGATNLLPLDTNGVRDVFLFDRKTNTLPNATTPPVVTITSPGNGSSVLVNTAIPITASATTTVGVVASVQFFVNGTSLGTSTVFPYTQTWTPTAVGTYTLSALVTDSFGNPGISSNVTVIVDAAPSVGVTSPVAGASITLGATQTVKATASPTTPGATITSVQFFANGVSLGTSTTAPYSEPWTPSSTGSYSLTVIATDSNGTMTTSPAVAVTVVTTSGTSTPPTVAIISPTNGASTIVNQTLTVTATAGSSSGGTVSSVQFLANGTSIGTASSYPFSVLWTPVTPGSYVLKAVATDNNGNLTTSAAVSVTVTTGVAPGVVITSPNPGAAYSVGASITISATASVGTGVVQNVVFYVNGVSFASVTNPSGAAGSDLPYNETWTPPASGSYTFTAVATDSSGNQTTSTAVTITVAAAGAPSVAITSPTSGGTVPINVPETIISYASSSTGSISSVQFFANGLSIGTVSDYPFQIAWTPQSNGTYTLLAVATDSSSRQTTSSPVIVTTTTGGAPTVVLTNPPSGSVVSSGVPIQLSATAGDAFGSVKSVQFLVGGATVATATAAPYTGTWTPTVAGVYTLVAEATDSFGNVTQSTPATVTVVTNKPPTVSVTSPSTGAIVAVNSGLTLSATASSSNGSVASVQFYVNGVATGAALAASPYTTAFTPPSGGIYTITAVAIDNTGAVATSPAVTIEAASNGAGTAVYSGTYQSLTDAGRFELVTVDGQYATFISHSTSGGSAPVVYSDLALNGTGGFSSTAISGTTSATGVSGTFNGGKDLFIGPVTFQGSVAVASGYYTGSLSGQATSQIYAIVGFDGSIMIYVGEGSFADVFDGSVDSTGAFSGTTVGNNPISGSANPTTGFLTGTLGGSTGGSILGARVSGGTFSDGVLRNLSTRGQAGTGANIMIAGFVIGGTAPKQLLVRAIGPTLSQYGITGYLPATQLSLYNSSNTLIGLNQGWTAGTTGSSVVAATAASMASVGAFSLPVGSGDSAFVTTLSPGSYSAELSGVGGTIGVGLVEIYDMDQLQPFSTQKLVNVSTRGLVGSGAQQTLIGGLVISGTAPKRLLIRGVGPTLSQFLSAGTTALSNPVLRLYNSAGTLLRENTIWGTGNDVGLVTSAAVQTGATPLASGSADSVILATLVPGTYTAQVTGVGSSTGVALVEVYEVP